MSSYVAWRYRQAPTQEAVLALAGSECVAKMFVLRRPYHTPDGVRDCVEPFEWYASEGWRPRGAGLRVVRRLMAAGRPIVALGGTSLATSLVTRLGWTRVGTVGTYVLPLRGAYLRARGRNALLAGAFDLFGRRYFSPSTSGHADVKLRRADGLSADIAAIARGQRRFAWMRLPDATTREWLRHAPPEVGTYATNEILVSGEVVGWASARTYTSGGTRTGAIQEVFLRDDARRWYTEAVRAVSVELAAQGVDALMCVTSCPDTAAALRALRFRHDADEGGFVWMGDDRAPSGPALLDGRHADRAFFPLPTASEVPQPVIATAS